PNPVAPRPLKAPRDCLTSSAGATARAAVTGGGDAGEGRADASPRGTRQSFDGGRSVFQRENSEGEGDRELGQAVDSGDAFVDGVAVEPQAPDPLRQERQALLQLDPREVRAEAVVHSGAERQRPCPTPLGGYVERGRATRANRVGLEVAVARERAHHHD